MAASPTPDPSQQPQGGAPPAGPGGGGAPGGDPSGGGGAPSQAPADPHMRLLGQIAETLKAFSAQVPAASAGLSKAVAGINEAQTAMVSQPQAPAPSQSPSY